MANKMAVVEQIEKEMRLGWPEGTNDLYKRVPQLLARIQELETALVPFARAARSELSVTGGTASTPEMIHVYTKDCVAALNVIDPSQAEQKVVDNFFSMPAEG